jgi:hypothetical protein
MLGSIAIDVHPPRASRREKRLRPLRRKLVAGWQHSDGMADRVFRFLVSGCETDGRPAASIAARMIVPGWPQIYCGREFRGRCFFFVYCAMLLAGLLFFGSGFGSICLGLAVSCHASSIIDVVARPDHGVIERIAISLVAILVTALLIYAPAAAAINVVARPVVIQQPASPLHVDDVLLVNRWKSPGVGDVVLFVLPRQTIEGNHRRTIITGDRVDRIVAGPGDRVSIADGKLQLNGQDAVFQPLNPARIPQSLNIVVPRGNWLIIPTTDAMLDTALMMNAAVIPANHVEGVVWWRSHPFTRFGRVSSAPLENRN